MKKRKTRINCIAKSVLLSLALLLLFGGCSNALPPDDPYIDVKNACSQYVDSILPQDASVFDFIVEAEPLRDNYDFSGFQYIEEGNPNLVVIRVGGTETQHTDGTDNCYAEFLCDIDTTSILAYRVTFKEPQTSASDSSEP